jgi:flagellar basal body P-ring formation protein FlgA
MWGAAFILAAFAVSAQAGCIAVEGGEITAGDIAKASSEFAKLDPSLVFSFAPAVGNQRIIGGAELKRWAADHGLGNPVADASLCFERAGRELDAQQIMEAMRRAIRGAPEDLRIEVVETCRCRVPAGQLEFSLSGASQPPAGHPDIPVLWRGRLVDADGHASPVWARVRVTASVIVVRAAVNLRARQVLSGGDLEEVRISESPLRFSQAQTAATFEGKIMNASLARGAILQTELVHAPYDVERGSLVNVEVFNGGAHLVLAAKAETAGNRGEIITLTNPAGAARFPARVTGQGCAEVTVAPERFMAAKTVPQMQAESGLGGRSF